MLGMCYYYVTTPLWFGPIDELDSLYIHTPTDPGLEKLDAHQRYVQLSCHLNCYSMTSLHDDFFHTDFKLHVVFCETIQKSSDYSYNSIIV